MADETLSPLEKDARLFDRVTEALRAGPGTAAWEEALTEIGGTGDASAAGEAAKGMSSAGRGDVAAEMEALAKARRRLASGRNWREVSAGEGFTAKLFAGLDGAAPTQRSGPTITRLIVILALALIAGVAIASVLLFRKGAPEADTSPRLSAQPDRPDDRPRTPDAKPPEKTGYGAPRFAWDFGMPWPAGTSVAGTLPLDSSGEGLRVRPGSLGKEWQGAAAFASTGFPADADVVIELTLDLPETLDPDVVTQLFVTPRDSLDPIRGTATAEWVWQLDDDGMKVISGGGASFVKIAGRPPSGTAVIRVTLHGPLVTVSGAGIDTPWDGPHGLDGEGQRYLGVRFLARGKPHEGALPTVKLLRVLNVR